MRIFDQQQRLSPTIEMQVGEVLRVKNGLGRVIETWRILLIWTEGKKRFFLREVTEH